MCYSQIWQKFRGDEYLCKLGKEYLNASLCKCVVYSLQNSETFDVSHVTNQMPSYQCSSRSGFFGPPCSNRLCISMCSSCIRRVLVVYVCVVVVCVVVVGAVDDHFRKSLGPSWHGGGAVNSSPAHSAVSVGTQPDSSVDDHFARALGGDTWRRIKADHERSTSVPPCTSIRYFPS